MKQSPAPSYWMSNAEPGMAFMPLQGDASATACVVGGGYLGLSTALHLAEAGVDTVLLEAQEPGFGASGRNGGQIIKGFKSERSELVEKLGEVRGNRLFAWSARFVEDTIDLISRHGIECQASQPGWLQPAHSAKALAAYEKRAEERRKAGIPARILSRAEAADMLGTDWYFGAYYDESGGRLHPLSYARGLARAASAKGARIHAHSAVETVRREAGRWRVETAAGHVLADQVLICTNAYTDSGSPLIPNLGKSIVSVPSYMIATAPLSPNLRASILPGGQTAADLKKLTNHFRLERDGRFLFGGRGALPETDHPSSFREVKRMLAQIYPQLSDQPIEFRWSGRVAVTTDGSPHLHAPAPGLWAMLGCNGRGVGYCTSAGKVMSQLMQGMEIDESPIPVTRIKPIAFHSFHVTGSRVALWWKHRSDLRERRAS
jgi:glycine/D-amino acid oxidase-like deaminating enzyme